MNANITKTIVTAVVILLSINAFAQSQWSVTAGYVQSDKNLLGNNGVTLTTNDSGLYAGLGCETPLSGNENLFYETQFLYTYLGGNNGNDSNSFHMINMPLRLKFKIPVADQLAFFAYGGPLASFGIVAKYKEGNLSTSYYKQNGLNRFDVKLGIGGGIEINQTLNLRLGYDWGMFNLFNGNDNAGKLKMNWLYVGIAFNCDLTDN